MFYTKPFVFYVFRNLADVSNDNVLNVEEFVLAMHLIRKVRGGLSVPRSLPKHLVPVITAPPSVDEISDRDGEAYQNVFNKLSTDQINGKKMQSWILLISLELLKRKSNYYNIVKPSKTNSLKTRHNVWLRVDSGLKGLYIHNYI